MPKGTDVGFFVTTWHVAADAAYDVRIYQFQGIFKIKIKNE